MDFFFHYTSSLLSKLLRFLLLLFPHWFSIDSTSWKISPPFNGFEGGSLSILLLKGFLWFQNSWLLGSQWWWHKYAFFPLCFSLHLGVSKPQYRHALYPLIVQPAKFLYTGKSFMVYSKTTLRLKNSFLLAS